MYPISNIGKSSFANGNIQKCNIEITTGGNVYTLNESNLRSLKFTRKSTNESNIYLGSVIASQIDLTIDNASGSFNAITFEGADLNIQLGVQTEADVYYMPIGRFTVDTVPRVLSQINLSALDRMLLFDKKPSDELGTWFPCTIKSLVEHICQTCNVTLYTDITSYPNATYVVNDAPEVDTYRELLSYCLEVMGKCAYFDWNGEMRIEWYHSTNEEIDESLRFSSDIYENSVTFGGVTIIQDKVEYTSGSGNKFVIENNPLVSHDEETILSNLSTSISIYPFSATTLPLPYLYPMDGVTFKKGLNSYSTYVTGISITMNGECAIEGVGESNTELSYASQNALTSREKVIIENLRSEMNETLNRRINDVISLNELVYNAMGFWKTIESSGNGQIMYMHDAPTLNESTKVWRMSAGTFSWTDDYEGNATVWQYGISTSGDAWFRKVSAIGLVLASANEEFTSQFTPSSWEILKGTMTAMRVTTNNNEVQMQIPKLVIDDPLTSNMLDGYLENGMIRMTPFIDNGACVGTGIMQLDQ